MSRMPGLCVGIFALMAAAPAALAQPPLPPPVPGYSEITSKYKNLVPSLIHALKDKNEEVRDAAARALANIGPETVPALIAALKSTDPAQQASAAEALGRIGIDAHEAIPTLLTLLKSTDDKVRIHAALALAGIAKNHRSTRLTPIPPPSAPPR